MVSTVIIPCWRKPAFLEATLRLIESARGANRQRYLFSIDRGADRKIDEVIAGFKFLPLSSTIRRKHSYPGNSYNILESLKSVSGPGDPNDLIYLIEDDIFVAEDFFEFHEDAHALEDAFFVTACRGSLRRVLSSADFVYRSYAYRSHGVSFKAHRLAAIVDHATKDYYRDMVGYVAKTFDNSIPITCVEQDSLTLRVMRRSGIPGLYPALPRAFHAGCIGYNHGRHDSEADELTADQLLELASRPGDHLNSLADPNYRDIESCELIRPRVSLRLV